MRCEIIGYKHPETAAGYTARRDVSDPALAEDYAWFRGWMRLDQFVSVPSGHAQLFRINERFPKAALVDTESGCVAVLT